MSTIVISILCSITAGLTVAAILSFIKKSGHLKISIWYFPFVLMAGTAIMPIVNKIFNSNQETIFRKHFGNEQIVIDGVNFVECTFDRTELIFSAKRPFSIERCKFIQPLFTFQGYAGNTILALQSFCYDNSGLNEICEKFITKINSKSNE